MKFFKHISFAFFLILATYTNAFLDFFNSDNPQNEISSQDLDAQLKDDPSSIGNNFSDLNYSDWTLRCLKKKKDDCNVIQTLINEKKQILFTFRIIPSKSQNLLIITLPLGVSIAPGIVMSFNDSSYQLPFNACDLNGCNAIGKLDKTTLNKFIKFNQMTLKLVNSKGKKLNVPISLKGFSAAYNAIP